MRPLVSIIIPAYNRALLLKEAIQSVLDQSLSNFELIIVDDGSTDNTSEVVADFQDPRLSYYYQTNQGRSAARNYGARLAISGFLGFLDSDDRYLPDCLESHIKVISKGANQNPNDRNFQNYEIGMTVGGYQFIDESGEVFAEREPWRASQNMGIDRWLVDCFAIPGSVLIRRSWFDRVGGFNILPERETAEDWELFLDLAVAGCPMDWVQTPVCQYRQHSGNSTQELTRHLNASIQMMKDFFARNSYESGKGARLDKSQENRVTARIYIYFARKHMASGESEPAIDLINTAITIDPSLKDHDRENLLAILFTPIIFGSVDPIDIAPHMILGMNNNFLIRLAEIYKIRALYEINRYLHPEANQIRITRAKPIPKKNAATASRFESPNIPDQLELTRINHILYMALRSKPALILNRTVLRYLFNQVSVKRMSRD